MCTPRPRNKNCVFFELSGHSGDSGIASDASLSSTKSLGETFMAELDRICKMKLTVPESFVAHDEPPGLESNNSKIEEKVEGWLNELTMIVQRNRGHAKSQA